MRFTPKQESELSTGFKPLPTGTYPFTVLESDLQISKSAKNAGKEMVKLKLNVHGPEFDKHVYDYFADWFSEWKLKHFCDTSGLSGAYEAGEIYPDGNAYQGRSGFVKIGIEVNKDTGEERNTVVDYIASEQPKAEPKKKKTATASAAPAGEPLEGDGPQESDDVPF